jgi:hypothetical protein
MRKDQLIILSNFVTLYLLSPFVRADGGSPPPPAPQPTPPILTPNPCHSDCQPFQCHGPTHRNCLSCAGNLLLKGDLCVCKPGYFSVQGRCDVYLPYCAKMQIVNNIVSCVQCQTQRDILDTTTGVCSRSVDVPFFYRSTAGPSSTSTENTTDSGYFYTNRCMTLDSLGKCLDCYPDSYLSATKTCVRREQYCDEFDALDRCSVSSDSTYIVSQSPFSVGFCFGTCRTCSATGYYKCYSCYSGYYFEPTPNQITGTCYKCHTKCRSCTGPTEFDCTVAVLGSYVERYDSATLRQVKLCQTGCVDCTSQFNCTRCSSKISENGVCGSSLPTILKCLYQYRYPDGTSSCFKYTNMITGTDFKSYLAPTSMSTLLSYCRYASNDYPDRISSICSTCNSPTTQQLDAGFCKSASVTMTSGCSKTLRSSSGNLICIECLDLALATDHTCQARCLASETTIAISTGKFCVPCPDGCNTCEYSTTLNKLVCTTCSAGFVLYKDFCSSQTCPDGYVGLNKQCDPNIPDQTATCTPDCLRFDPTECTSLTACSRHIFSLASTSTPNQILMTVVPRYTDYVVFSLAPGIAFDSTDPDSQLFFCSLLFPDVLDDSLASCSFSQSQQTVTLSVSSQLMSRMAEKTGTQIHVAAVSASRRLLNTVSFSVSPDVAVAVSAAMVAKSVAITAPSQASAQTDYPLSFEVTEAGLHASQVQWTVSACVVATLADDSRCTTINSHLQTLSTSSTAPLSLSQSVLVPDLEMTLQLTATFADGSVQTTTKHISFSAAAVALLTLVDLTPVRFVAGTPVTLLLSYSPSAIPSFDSSQVSAVFGGQTLVAGTDFTVVHFAETARVLLTFTPAGSGAVSELSLNYQPSATAAVPLVIPFVQKVKVQDANFLLPSSISPGSSFSFFTSLPNSYTYEAYLFSISTKVLLASQPSQSSNYHNTFTVPQFTTTEAKLVLYFRFTNANTKLIYKFELQTSSTAYTPEPNIFISTTYRDGSSLHNSDSHITIGIFKQNYITSLPSPTTQAAVFDYTTMTSTTKTLDITNLQNKLSLTPPLTSLVQRPYLSTFLYQYDPLSPSPRQSLQSHLSSYQPTPTPVLTLTPLTPLDSSSALFNIYSPSAVSTPNYYCQYSELQFTHSLKLHLNPTLNTTSHINPVVLSNSFKYSLLAFPPFVFTANSSLYPSIEMDVYDFNAFTTSDRVEMKPDDAWTGLQGNIADYISQQKTKRASLSANPLLTQLNIDTFVVNQGYVVSVLNGQNLVEYPPLNASRKELISDFRLWWDNVADKEAIQDWDNSVMKSSFLNGVSLDPKGLDNDDIEYIESELTRQVGSIFSQVKSTTNGMSRTSYNLIESLKPIKTITKTNADLLISTTTHAMRMYTNAYTRFADANALQTQLNLEHKRILGLNELKLVRYCHVSDSIVYQNEVITLGGATLTSPLSSSYVFNFSDSTAVEIKNLQFDSNLQNYELSVVTYSDAYYDELNKTLGSYNLTAESLNKSRTTIGFTNGFELVNPKIDPTTQINIYRPADECRGTPCDANKVLNYGKDIILCQCLTASDANKFSDSFKKLTEETGVIFSLQRKSSLRPESNLESQLSLCSSSTLGLPKTIMCG